MYVRAFFGLRVPDTKVCHDHSTPGDFVADAFFEKHPLMLVVASRHGYKTLLTAIIDVLDMWFKGAGIVHAGAIEAQANKGYSYVRDFCVRVFSDQLAGPPLMHQTTFKNGGKIEVYPMTMNKMAGPHEPKLRRDETDLAKPQALEQSKGIPTAKGEVKIGVIDTSSRYFSHGNVQRMIDEAEETGRKVHIWCYKEVTEKCKPERSGTTPTVAWIDREALHGVRPEEYRGFSESERQHYQRYDVWDGCHECALLPSCCGDLRRANGNQSIDEAVVQFREASAETWIAQFESRRATNEGVIYKYEWKPRYHLVGPWVLPANWKREGRIYRCLDFGRNRPSVGWVYADGVRDIHFAEIEPFDLTIDALKVEIRKVDERFGLRPEDVELTYCDPAGVQRTDMDIGNRLDKLGTPTVQPADGYNLKAVIPARIGVWNGLEAVKSRLKIEGGKALFQVVGMNCPETIKAFESYRKKRHGSGLWLNEPEDPQEFEHPMDRIRYFIVGKYKTKPSKWEAA
jgi:hypothetical protein